MEHIIIHIDSKSNADKIMDAIKLFKGVKKVAQKLTAKEIEALENTSIIKGIKAGRKTPKITESSIRRTLK